MPTIAIIGDSWGVPNYYGLPGIPPEHHIEYLLRNAGHTVLSFAINGGSNMKTLTKLSQYENKNDIDYVLWFHTDFFRDTDPFAVELIKTPYTIETFLTHIADVTYLYAQSIKQSMNAKFIVVGGQASVYKTYPNYNIADYIKVDWKSELVGKPLPSAHISDYAPDIIDSALCINSLESKLAYVEDVLMLYRQTNGDREKFPDGCHPGILPHQQLFDYVTGIIAS